MSFVRDERLPCAPSVDYFTQSGTRDRRGEDCARLVNARANLTRSFSRPFRSAQLRSLLCRFAIPNLPISSTTAAEAVPEGFPLDTACLLRKTRKKRERGRAENIGAFLDLTTRANLADRPGPGLIEKAAFLARPSRCPVC